MASTYTINQVPGIGEKTLRCDSPVWQKANSLAVDQFHPKTGAHRPKTQVRLLHDGTHIAVLFDVQDQYVIARAKKYQDMVCNDSCVEFFVRPRADKGYFNFELSGGGQMLLYYIEDHRRVPGGFERFTPVAAEYGKLVRVEHTLPATVDPELATPVRWQLLAQIPVSIMEAYVGPLGRLSGQKWRGNFFKCAEASSHPHWGTWAPIGSELNFHLPQYFGELELA